MKFDNIIICSDYDGTITGNFKNLSSPGLSNICPDNIEAIKYFARSGGRFVIASGRSHRTIGFLYDHLPLDDIFAGINGTGMYSMSQDKFVYRHAMRISPAEYTKAVISAVPEISCLHIANYDAVTSIWHKGDGDPVAFAEKTEKALKIIVEETNPEIMEKVARSLPSLFGGVCDSVKSCPVLMESMDAGAGKQEIVEFFKKHNPEKLIVALGDYENDIAMLKAADISFCPQNATASAKQNCSAVLSDSGNGFLRDVMERLEKL